MGLDCADGRGRTVSGGITSVVEEETNPGNAEETTFWDDYYDVGVEGPKMSKKRYMETYFRVNLSKDFIEKHTIDECLYAFGQEFEFVLSSMGKNLRSRLERFKKRLDKKTKKVKNQTEKENEND